MNTIIRAFKKFILRRQIKNCKLKQIQMDAKLDRYHNIIIKKIIEGEDKVKIEKLKLERDELFVKSRELITKKYVLMNQL